MYIKLAIFAVGILIAYVAQGWRYDAKIAKIEKDHAEAIAQAYAETKQKELSLQKEADKVKKEAASEVKVINDRLTVALNSLYNRPTRDSVSDHSTRTCTAANGQELSREDAEFLTRLAAKADTVVSALDACYQQYNALRNRLAE